MKNHFVLFDLDGTITDSSEGIVKSIVYALGKMGKEESDLERLKAYVGPSLKDTFQNNMDFYRQKYAEEFQAVLRDGVEYDEDSSGTIQASEKEPIHMLRLQR